MRLYCAELPQKEERNEAMRCIQKELYGEKDVNKTSIDREFDKGLRLYDISFIFNRFRLGSFSVND